MNKKRIEWANEEGSALVLTLMIFLVLTVLATSISFLTVGSFRLSDINRDGTSAFYIAEAGAKKAYEEASQEVMKTYEAATTTTSSDFYAALDALFLNKELSFDKQFGDDAKANVTFTATGSEPRKYTLTSIGSVGGKTRTVQKQFDVFWVDKGGSGGFPKLPENAALITKAGIDIYNNSITGDIYTYSNTGKSVVFQNSGPVFNNTTLFFPNTTSIDTLLDNQAKNTTVKYKEFNTETIKWETYGDLIKNYDVPTGEPEKLPETTHTNSSGHNYKVVDQDGNLKINSWEIDKYFQLDLTKDVKIPEIYVSQDKVLKINSSSGNRIIFVDNLFVSSGEIDVIGEGRVTIVVKGNVQFGHNAIINSGKNKDKLLMVYTGNSANFNNMTNFYGSLIIKNKNAKISMSQSAINGVLLTDSVEVNFNSDKEKVNMVLIAPNAKVSMSQGYSINGTVIANTFKLEGGAKLTHTDIKIPDFPGISGGATSTPTLEDLIQSGPILEQ